MSDAEADALYRKRLDQYVNRPVGAGLESYDLLVPVGGAPHPAPLPQATGVQRSISAEAIEAARDYAGRNNSSAFIVWQGGKIQDERYFGSFNRSSPIVSKSLAKPVGAIAIGRAIALGKIKSLDQPASTLFPEWRGTPKQAITIRMILGMRSGLLPQGAPKGPDDPLNKAYLHPFHDKILLEDYPLKDPPGTRYEYSNANGDLVALLIQRATGMAYQDWLAKQVFAPLGAAGGEIWLDRPGGTPHAGCCLLVPAETYLRLAILLAQDGQWNGKRLLPDGYVTAMRTPGADNPHAGLGVYVGNPYLERRGAGRPDAPFGQTFHSEPYAADDLFLFDGNSNQVVYIVPSRQLVILRTGDAPPKAPEWDNARLPNLILRGMR